MLHEKNIELHALVTCMFSMLLYMHVSCNMHGFGTFSMHVTCILHEYNMHALLMLHMHTTLL